MKKKTTVKYLQLLHGWSDVMIDVAWSLTVFLNIRIHIFKLNYWKKIVFNSDQNCEIVRF